MPIRLDTDYLLLFVALAVLKLNLNAISEQCTVGRLTKGWLPADDDARCAARFQANILRLVAVRLVGVAKAIDVVTKVTRV